MSIKAAVGVGQLDEALNQVHVRQGFLAELYCETMFSEIATTRWFDGLECGSTVTIKHEPDFEFKDYEKDQEIDYETPKVCTTTIGVHYASYAAVKFDDIDKKHLCDYGMLRPEFEKKIRRKANEKIERTIFSHIYKEAHSQNIGLSAGETGMYNLGYVGNPFEANPDSLIDLLLSMGGVMDDQCTEDSGRWVVFPKEAKQLFGRGLINKTVLNGTCGVCSDSRTGQMYSDLSGFNIYFSSRLPRCQDPITGDITWIIPFGIQESMGYTADIGQFETVRLEKAFGDGIRVLVTYGAGAGRPEGLGYAYISINPQGGA